MKELEIEAGELEAEVIQKIIDLAGSIGWSFAIQESTGEDDIMDHLIVGTQGALVEIDKAHDMYEIWSPPKEDKKVVH